MTRKSEVILVGQIGIRFLLETAEPNSSVAIFDFTVPTGARVPAPQAHAHYA